MDTKLTRKASGELHNCKNKVVVLTTEWLPWFQTNRRNSSYDKKITGMHREASTQFSYNHNTLTTPQNICKGRVITNALITNALKYTIKELSCT